MNLFGQKGELLTLRPAFLFQAANFDLLNRRQRRQTVNGEEEKTEEEKQEQEEKEEERRRDGPVTLHTVLVYVFTERSFFILYDSVTCHEDLNSNPFT